MSQSTRLRTLARKSRIGFGKYADCTVQNMLDMGLPEQQYLTWVYYNAGQISFLPDILEELRITEEWRIPKPGKEKNKHIDFGKATYTQKERLKLVTRANKLKGIKYQRVSRAEYNANDLRLKNHGHNVNS